MSTREKPELLILLVGSNPLPNYLAAVTLAPQRVCLVYSKETQEPMERLKKALEGHKDKSKIDLCIHEIVEDPTSVTSVQATILKSIEAGSPSSVHLHYTGGTKVMAAHALHVFYNSGGEKSRASYLNEKTMRVRFDDGNDIPLKSDSVTLESVLGLHGVTYKPRSTVDCEPTSQDARVLAKAICERPQLASCLYGERQRLQELSKVENALACPFRGEDYDLKLSNPEIPAQGMKKKLFECWYKFLGGEWLEEWVKALILDLEAPDSGQGSSQRLQVITGINGTRVNSSRKFEVDVGFVKSNRSFFISCTTDTTLGLCKSKAFEISTRAEQMGGGLARGALVCLLLGENQGGSFLSQLREDLADAWGASNTTQVFGLEDVRQWAGHYNDGNPDLSSLKAWMNS